MTDFRKHWLNELKQNDFISSDKMSPLGMNVGMITDKSVDYFTIRFSLSERNADIMYDIKNGVFVAIKASSLPFDLPNLVNDRIHIPSEKDVEEFIANQFYNDGMSMLEKVVQKFDKTFNPNVQSSNNNSDRYSVMDAICNLSRRIK